jgi:hypothetical protein
MIVRFAAFCLGATAVLAGTALATPPTADCEVVEVGATTEKTPSIDPALRRIEGKLKKTLGGVANTYKQLSASNTPLTQNTPNTVPLKNGKATVMLRSRTKTRFELTVSIDDSGGKRWVANTQAGVDNGDWLMFARDLPNNAAHLVAVSCR